MADAASNPFESGRANLRDTAKWMVSGTMGAATLIVGSSTISQLGTLELDSARLWCAVISLLLAAGLCWVPFKRAVAVLRSELQSLRQFADADCGEYRNAADEVAKHFGSSFPEGKNLRQFVADYENVRDRAWNAEPDASKKDDVVADIDGWYQTCRDACVAQLVAIRFEKLAEAVKFPGVVILVSFLIFAWAANPPKDVVKVLDKPYLEGLTADDVSALKEAKLAPSCFGSGVRFIVIAAPEVGPQTAVLSGPGCSPHKITLSNDKIIQVN